MKFFGVEITFDEMDKLCGKIVNFINREKNAKCLVLDLFNSNIQDWYNEIRDNFSPWIANGMKMERSQTPKELSKCVHNDDRIKTADKLLATLESRLKDQDLKSITEIYGSFVTVRKEKSHWLDDAVKTNLWNRR